MRALRAPAALAAMATAVFVSLLATVPMVVSGNLGRDSGVFLYTGMVTARGGMPYVDSWDHKGPLLAAIEAVAWRVGGGIVGAPLLEGLALAVGLAVAGVLWSRRLGLWAVPAIVLTGVSYLAVFEGGNFTETWLFPAQIVAYSVVAEAALRVGKEPSARLASLVGAVVGLALAVGLFTRMNNVLGLLALAVLIVIVSRRRMIFAVVVSAVVLLIGGALVLWLWSGNALRAAADQYLRYNLFYSGGAPVSERLAAFTTLAQILVSSAVVAVLCLTLVAGAIHRHRQDAAPARASMIAAVFIGVGGIDALSQMVSGRPYPHYLIVAIAGFAVSLVVVASQLVPSVPPGAVARVFTRRALPVAASITAVIALALSSSVAATAYGLWFRSDAGAFVAGSYQRQIIDRVIAETSPDDRVLVHGAETWILAAADRLSPTSITYSLPVEQGYGELPQQYFNDIASRPPALIVESPTSCGISDWCPPEKDHFPQLDAFVTGSYRLEGEIVGFKFWRRVVD
ncbi:4-amino-4-deoxy-L-arabinose transferase [Microbacterium testaceum StLB037]|uniref:4-amino-4-deoxy-L-arabinose transferase n=1 Tax=Microbacterium testaceum (strain StLB037) TaxID=979556 RepID=E8NF55_MICTS|nr:hypothetical protein [Microbacterium testaceum]BAJ73909.1 4-amino-4-deoxy-L-arabinose transferase [Microbacterium testaceum StLB037]